MGVLLVEQLLMQELLLNLGLVGRVALIAGVDSVCRGYPLPARVLVSAEVF
jgi:hypothetical protein